MWGTVNIASIAFLLFTVIGIVFLGVSRGNPNWVSGQVQSSLIEGTNKNLCLSRPCGENLIDSTSEASKAAKMSLAQFEETYREGCKNTRCESETSCTTDGGTPDEVCELAGKDMKRLEKYENYGESDGGGIFIVEWTRGLQRQCYRRSYRSATSETCSQQSRGRLRSSVDDAKKTDQATSSIIDMLLVCIVLEVAGFVIRSAAIVTMYKLPHISQVMRGYILLPVADTLLKILSCVLFVGNTQEEAFEFGFILFVVSVACSGLSLMAAIWDQRIGGKSQEELEEDLKNANIYGDSGRLPPPYESPSVEPIGRRRLLDGDPNDTYELTQPPKPPPQYREDADRYAAGMGPSKAASVSPYQGSPYRPEDTYSKDSSRSLPRNAQPRSRPGPGSQSGSRQRTIPREHGTHGRRLGGGEARPPQPADLRRRRLDMYGNEEPPRDEAAWNPHRHHSSSSEESIRTVGTSSGRRRRRDQGDQRSGRRPAGPPAGPPAGQTLGGA